MLRCSRVSVPSAFHKSPNIVRLVAAALVCIVMFPVVTRVISKLASENVARHNDLPSWPGWVGPDKRRK